MRIAVLNASSQKEKNPLLLAETQRAVQGKGHEVFNFGIFPEEAANCSYIQTALCVSLLLESGTADFAVTGCSSGTGMMLACNSLPGVLCGYLPTPADAFLFGRINAGNAASLPLGLNFGWAGELNLRYTLEKLFEEPFGTGYPAQDAARKRKDTKILKELKAASQKRLTDVLPALDPELIRPILSREIFYSRLMEQGRNDELKRLLKSFR